MRRPLLPALIGLRPAVPVGIGVLRRVVRAVALDRDENGALYPTPPRAWNPIPPALCSWAYGPMLATKLDFEAPSGNTEA